MSPWLTAFELMCLALGAGGYALGRWMDPRKRARRVLARVSDTPIRELADGDWARVTGRVAALDALAPSPITQRPCIGFRLVVETAVRNDPSNGFTPLLTRESCQPFSISDDTGTAIVEGPFLMGLDVDDSSWTDLPPTLFKLLEEVGAPPGVTHFRFRECWLLPGDRVTVAGAVSVGVHPAGEPRGFREPPVMRRIVGTDRAPVLLRDAVEEALP
jgi:hypothetical protein